MNAAQTSSENPVVVLGRIIERERSEIERRWLERVQEDVARTRGVALTQLRDGLPHYLTALVTLLLAGSSAPDGSTAWADVAREHGITRVNIGFDVTQLFREFRVLKQVLRDVVAEQGAMVDGVERLLTDILDAGATAALRSYVEARDFEARRKQAEHVGFLTHELRSPLSTATLAASQLRRLATPEQVPVLESLDRNHRKLSDLIDGVLLTERLEAGKVRCEPSDTRLGDLMEPALERARAMASEKKLTFRVSYDPELHVRLDPDLTRSALQNVAENAARYTDQGGVQVTVDDRPDKVIIHVRDSGTGLSEKDLRRIFEPFERGSTRKPGTGLGLAIARRAIEAQGGSIGAESPGRSGCHFWIQLPK